MEEKNYLSWAISDELWEALKEKVPVRQRNPQKQYKHAPGQGRPALPARKVLEGILYVLRTGCQWKAVPQEYGCGSSIHRYYREWTEAGFFQEIWTLSPEKYDELEGIGWEWRMQDNRLTKVQLPCEAIGRNLTSRKRNTHTAKRIDERRGIPADRRSIWHTRDMRPLENLMDFSVAIRPVSE